MDILMHVHTKGLCLQGRVLTSSANLMFSENKAYTGQEQLATRADVYGQDIHDGYDEGEASTLFGFNLVCLCLPVVTPCFLDRLHGRRARFHNLGLFLVQVVV
jgi:hypothetical protein